MQQVTKDMIDCWRANYGLDKRSPEDAARWWDDECGMAPAGAVAALGLALRELEARTSRDADWYMAVVWPLLPVPGEFDGMDACDQSRWRSVVRIAIEHTLAGERGMTPNGQAQRQEAQRADCPLERDVGRRRDEK